MGNMYLYKAKAGGDGEASHRTGASADDLIVGVPRGTLVKDEAGHILADLVEIGQSWIGARGGKGGSEIPISRHLPIRLPRKHSRSGRRKSSYSSRVEIDG
jgi:GTP-binding protein